ncbi:MAG: serine hydrolase domain-containing protein, partial [Bacteroidota bacterium]
MRSIIILLLYFACVSCTPPPDQDKNKSQSLNEKIARVENGLQPRLQIIGLDVPKYNVEERLKELGIPGVSVAVFKDGEVEWAKGYGMADSAEQRPVTTETLFQAGSISKAVAALRALQLKEKGTLDVDANVNDYLTSWQLPDNEFTTKEKVTTRRILTHTAGLTVHGFPGYPRKDAIPSIPDILDGKGNTDPVRVFKKPGTPFRYSGGGYTIMQQMIADLEERPFANIMDEEVLRPLGMEVSTYQNPLPEQHHARAATGYHSDGSEVAGKWHVYPEMAAAGLWTTPSELILWGKAIQQVQQSQENG